MNAVTNMAWRARLRNMALTSSGPFTRVSFVHIISEPRLVLYQSRKPDTAGVRLHRIESGEFPRNYWEQR